MAKDLPWYIEQHIYKKLLFSSITKKNYRNEELQYIKVLAPNIKAMGFLKSGKAKLEFSLRYIKLFSNAHKALTYDYNLSNYANKKPKSEIGKIVLLAAIAPIEYVIGGLSHIFTNLIHKLSVKEEADFTLQWKLNIDSKKNNNTKWQ